MLFYASSNYFTFYYRHFVSFWSQVGGLNIKGVLMFVAVLLGLIVGQY
jgi:hypothetical protein